MSNKKNFEIQQNQMKILRRAGKSAFSAQQAVFKMWDAAILKRVGRLHNSKVWRIITEIEKDIENNTKK